MESTLLVFTGLILAIFASYRIVRDAARVLLADRARRQRLQVLERYPPPAGLQVAQAGAREIDESAARSLREELSVTGVMVASIGVGAVFIGRALAYGDWAVGLYVGGLISIVSGVALALAGSVLRVIAKPLLREGGDAQP